MAKATPFNNNLNSNDLGVLFGFSYCLKGLMQFLQEETQFDPKKRMIDSVKLLDKIGASSELVGKLMKEHEQKIIKNSMQ